MIAWNLTQLLTKGLVGLNGSIRVWTQDEWNGAIRFEYLTSQWTFLNDLIKGRISTAYYAACFLPLCLSPKNLHYQSKLACWVKILVSEWICPVEDSLCNSHWSHKSDACKKSHIYFNSIDSHQKWFLPSLAAGERKVECLKWSPTLDILAYKYRQVALTFSFEKNPLDMRPKHSKCDP